MPREIRTPLRYVTDDVPPLRRLAQPEEPQLVKHPKRGRPRTVGIVSDSKSPALSSRPSRKSDSLVIPIDDDSDVEIIDPPKSLKRKKDEDPDWHSEKKAKLSKTPRAPVQEKGKKEKSLIVSPPQLVTTLNKNPSNVVQKQPQKQFTVDLYMECREEPLSVAQITAAKQKRTQYNISQNLITAARDGRLLFLPDGSTKILDKRMTPVPQIASAAAGPVQSIHGVNSSNNALRSKSPDLFIVGETPPKMILPVMPVSQHVNTVNKITPITSPPAALGPVHGNHGLGVRAPSIWEILPAVTPSPSQFSPPLPPPTSVADFTKLTTQSSTPKTHNTNKTPSTTKTPATTKTPTASKTPTSAKTAVISKSKTQSEEVVPGRQPQQAETPVRADSEPQKKKASKKVATPPTEEDDSGNWVPLDEYYYGKMEGDPTYQETKGEHRFKCWYCNKMLYNNVAAMMHIQGHIDSERQVNLDLSDLTQCKHCYKQFDTPFEMQTHIEKVHMNNTNVLLCRICEKSHDSRQNLKDHMRKFHNSCEMPYICQLCKFRSSMYSDVVDHFKKKHNSSDAVLCMYCLRVFHIRFVSQGWGQTSIFYNHLMKHQVKNSCKRCQLCRLVFLNPGDLKTHRKMDHLPNQKGIIGINSKYTTPDQVMIKVTEKSEVPAQGGGVKSLNVPAVKKITEHQLIFSAGVKKVKCIECKQFMGSPDHFKKFIQCSMCRFATSCSFSYSNHMMGFHSGQVTAVSSQLPVESKLESKLYCACGFVSTYGNKIANHLVSCSKISCSKDPPYLPNVDESGQELQDPRKKPDASLLDVLGLVKKNSHQPSTSRTPSQDSPPPSEPVDMPDVGIPDPDKANRKSLLLRDSLKKVQNKTNREGNEKNIFEEFNFTSLSNKIQETADGKAAEADERVTNSTSTVSIADQDLRKDSKSSPQPGISESTEVADLVAEDDSETSKNSQADLVTASGEPTEVKSLVEGVTENEGIEGTTEDVLREELKVPASNDSKPDYIGHETSDINKLNNAVTENCASLVLSEQVVADDKASENESDVTDNDASKISEQVVADDEALESVSEVSENSASQIASEQAATYDETPVSVSNVTEDSDAQIVPEQLDAENRAPASEHVDIAENDTSVKSNITENYTNSFKISETENNASDIESAEELFSKNNPGVVLSSRALTGNDLDGANYETEVLTQIEEQVDTVENDILMQGERELKLKLSNAKDNLEFEKTEMSMDATVIENSSKNLLSMERESGQEKADGELNLDEGDMLGYSNDTVNKALEVQDKSDAIDGDGRSKDGSSLDAVLSKTNEIQSVSLSEDVDSSMVDSDNVDLNHSTLESNSVTILDEAISDGRKDVGASEERAVTYNFTSSCGDAYTPIVDENVDELCVEQTLGELQQDPRNIKDNGPNLDQADSKNILADVDSSEIGSSNVDLNHDLLKTNLDTNLDETVSDGRKDVGASEESSVSYDPASSCEDSGTPLVDEDVDNLCVEQTHDDSQQDIGTVREDVENLGQAVSQEILADVSDLQTMEDDGRSHLTKTFADTEEDLEISKVADDSESSVSYSSNQTDVILISSAESLLKDKNTSRVEEADNLEEADYQEMADHDQLKLVLSVGSEHDEGSDKSLSGDGFEAKRVSLSGYTSTSEELPVKESVELGESTAANEDKESWLDNEGRQLDSVFSARTQGQTLSGLNISMPSVVKTSPSRSFDPASFNESEVDDPSILSSPLNPNPGSSNPGGRSRSKSPDIKKPASELQSQSREISHHRHRSRSRSPNVAASSSSSSQNQSRDSGYHKRRSRSRSPGANKPAASSSWQSQNRDLSHHKRRSRSRSRSPGANKPAASSSWQSQNRDLSHHKRRSWSRSRSPDRKRDRDTGSDRHRSNDRHRDQRSRSPETDRYRDRNYDRDRGWSRDGDRDWQRNDNRSRDYGRDQDYSRQQRDKHWNNKDYNRYQDNRRHR